MEHSKENIIQLLKLIIENKMEMYRIFKKDGDEDTATKFLRDAMAYETCLDLITNKNQFDTYVNIFVNHKCEKNMNEVKIWIQMN